MRAAWWMTWSATPDSAHKEVRSATWAPAWPTGTSLAGPAPWVNTHVCRRNIPALSGNPQHAQPLCVFSVRRSVALGCRREKWYVSLEEESERAEKEGTALAINQQRWRPVMEALVLRRLCGTAAPGRRYDRGMKKYIYSLSWHILSLVQDFKLFIHSREGIDVMFSRHPACVRGLCWVFDSCLLFLQCNVLCGSGSQRRDIICVQKLGSDITVVPSTECAHLDKPAAVQECEMGECQPQWFTTEWSAVRNEDKIRGHLIGL